MTGQEMEGGMNMCLKFVSWVSVSVSEQSGAVLVCDDISWLWVEIMMVD